MCQRPRMAKHPSISVRKEGHGCPYCSGHRVLPEDSLAARFPQIAAQWHHSKNAPLTPSKVRPGSARRIWWQCASKQEHVWETEVVARTSRGSGCPFCSGRYRTAETTFAGKFRRSQRSGIPLRMGVGSLKSLRQTAPSKPGGYATETRSMNGRAKSVRALSTAELLSHLRASDLWRKSESPKISRSPA